MRNTTVRVPRSVRRPASRVGLAIVLLALVGLGWLAFRGEPARSRASEPSDDGAAPEPEPAAPPSAVALSEPSIPPAEPEGSKPPDDGDRRARVEAEDHAPPHPRSARFVHEDGVPASDLALAGAHSRTYGDERYLRFAPATWDLRTDGIGELDAEGLELLGPIAAARLGASALVVLPLDPRESTYVLPSVVEPRFALAGAGESDGVVAELRITSHELSSFVLDPAVPWDTSMVGLADRFQPHAHVLDAPALLAEEVLRLDSSAGPARVALPLGRYYVAVDRCSFGWWVRGLSNLEVDGTPVVLEAYRVPLARLSLADPRTGELRQPKEVRLVCRRFRGSGPWEMDLPWELRSDFVEVALTVSERSEPLTYAYRVYWSDGTTSDTPFGAWGALKGAVPFQNE